MFSAITHDIRVTAKPLYLAEESRPDESFYAWSYEISIENLSNHKVQLLNRHWEIIDANGVKHTVNGAGVVGKQPILLPKQKFEYTSWSTLGTPSGIMRGHYEMLNESNRLFNIEIPSFSLDSFVAAQLVN